MLATSHTGTGIALWDLATKTIRVEFPLGESSLSENVYEAAFDRQGHWFAAASAKIESPELKGVTVFDVTGRNDPISLDRQNGTVSNLRFSDDGTRLKLVNWNGVPTSANFTNRDFREFEVVTGKQLTTRPIAIPQPQWSKVRISLDQKTMVVVDLSGRSLTIWDTETGRVTASLADSTVSDSRVESVFISPESATVAVCKIDGAIDLWEITTRRLRATLRGHSPRSIPFRVNFSADPNVLISEGKEHLSPSPAAQFVESALRQVRSSKIFYADRLETIVWDLKTGKVRVLLPDRVQAVVSEDGTRLAATGVGNYPMIRVYDLTKP